MTCPKCGAHVPEVARSCPNCLAQVPHDGWLGRLLRRLGLGSRAGTRGSTKTYTISTERIKIRDPRTGELRVYDALEDVPEDLRKEIAETLRGAAGGGRRTRIAVRDPSGATRTYDSIEAMPADVRKIYERVRGEGRP